MNRDLMNRSKVQLSRPEPGLEQALNAHRLEVWFPLIGAGVALIAVLAIGARVVLGALG